MAHRKSLIQVKFRFRKDLLARVEAKRHDRSTNDEIARLVEEGLECEDWREDREKANRSDDY